MEQESKGKVGIFIPCCIDQFAPQTAHNTTKLLSCLGVEPHYPKEQTCCGRMPYENGDRDNARNLGLLLIEAYADDSLVVCCDACCADYLQRHLKSLYDNGSHRQAAADLAGKSMPLADYLTHVLHYHPQAAFPHRVAWLDHCAMEPDDMHYTAPRKLLKALAGIAWTEIPQNYIGGHSDLHGILFPSLTATLIARQVQEAVAANVEYLVTADTTALIRLQNYCRKQAVPLHCVHLADLLANLLDTGAQ